MEFIIEAGIEFASKITKRKLSSFGQNVHAASLEIQRVAQIIIKSIERVRSIIQDIENIVPNIGVNTQLIKDTQRFGYDTVQIYYPT